MIMANCNLHGYRTDDQREVDNSLALIILERNYQGGLAQLVRAHA